MPNLFENRLHNPPDFDWRQVPRGLQTQLTAGKIILKPNPKFSVGHLLLGLMTLGLFSSSITTFLEDSTLLNALFLVPTFFWVLWIGLGQQYKRPVIVVEPHQIYIQIGLLFRINHTLPLSSIDRVTVDHAPNNWNGSQQKMLTLQGDFEPIKLGHYLPPNQTEYLGYALRYLVNLAQQEQLDLLDFSQHLIDS